MKGSFSHPDVGAWSPVPQKMLLYLTRLFRPPLAVEISLIRRGVKTHFWAAIQGSTKFCPNMFFIFIPASRSFLDKIYPPSHDTSHETSIPTTTIYNNNKIMEGHCHHGRPLSFACIYWITMADSLLRFTSGVGKSFLIFFGNDSNKYSNSKHDEMV